MRLTTDQVAIIKNATQSVLGVSARVVLFGSRVNDQLKGGDIDLLVEVDTPVSNKTQAIGHIYAKLIRQLGDRKIDILIKDATTHHAAVFDVAKQTGVVL